MSCMIPYVYIFNEDLDRVYECFSKYNIVSDVIYANYIEKVCIHPDSKGNNFDDINSCITLTFKNYYHITIIVESKIDKPYHRQIKSLLKIEEIPDFNFHLNQHFLWNSCDHKTILKYNFIFDDNFFYQLILDEFTADEKKQICINVENYLKKSAKGLFQIESTLIKGNIVTIWNLISDWNELFPMLDFKIKAEYDGDCRFLGTHVKCIYTENNKPFCSLVIKRVLMSEEKMELFFDCLHNDKCLLPDFTIYMKLNKLQNNLCFCTVTHNYWEYASLDLVEYMSKFKKKVLKFIHDYFESKN